ncbi:hypothetical protein PFFCH_01436 [Plasmodium falciparum FCH/4]|uniref:Uncharacterized protein n=1 Tax=Plasmodium falciparum FCH/4 TaxID=1036724 RepID=A0A024VT68_PLAFA|nr:hypothetical protein PFFCH_01436 [Plasmodium falciparum FCH/4]
MKDNKMSKNNIFIYNEKVKELLYELILLTNKLSIYRKKYIKYIRRKIDYDKYKYKSKFNNNDDNYAFLLFKNFNYHNEFLIHKYVKFKEGKRRYISNGKYKKEFNSSYDILEYYDKFINNLLYLCNNHTDIYIEFLYVLLINSQLFNRFLFLSTYISGDKKDQFLYLIYNHFLILVEYYHYYKNSSYYDDLYNNLKNTYDKIQTKHNDKEHYIEIKNKNQNHKRGNHNNLSCNTGLETNSVSPIQNFKKDPNTHTYKNFYKKERVKFLYNYSNKRNENFFTINNCNSSSNECNQSFSEYEPLNKEAHEKSIFFNKEENVYYVDDDKNDNNLFNENVHKKKKGKETKNIFNKFFFNLSESQNSLRNLYQNFYSKNKNRSYDSQFIDTKKRNSLQNKCFIFTNVNNFNIKEYYKLKHIFSIFQKLKIEHLYILLYFSLSILSTLFHIYLTRIMLNRKNPFFISTYLFYLSKKVKNKIFNNLYKYIQPNKDYMNRYMFKSDDMQEQKKKIINNDILINEYVSNQIGNSVNEGKLYINVTKNNNNNKDKDNYDDDNNNCHVQEKDITYQDLSIHYLINKYKHNIDNQFVNLYYKNKHNTSNDSITLFNHLTCENSLQNLNKINVNHIINKFSKEKENDIDNMDSFNYDIKMLHTFQLQDNLKKLNFQILNTKHENYILEECNGVLENIINKEEYNIISEEDEKIKDKANKNEKRQSSNQYNHNDDTIPYIHITEHKNDIIKENSKSNDEPIEGCKKYEKSKKSINIPEQYINNDKFYKFIEHHLEMKYIYLYYKNIEKDKLLNYVGFENLIKSLSIMCNEHFFSFYMNKINVKNMYEDNDNILNEAHNVNKHTIKTKIEKNKKHEEKNNKHEEKNKKHEEKNKKHEEKNKKHEEKNKKHEEKNKKHEEKNPHESDDEEEEEDNIDTLHLNNQKKKSELQNDDFLYIQSQNGNNVINNKDQHIYNDIFKFIQNKNYHNKNDDIIHTNCSSYENSDSSDNLTLYNYSKNYYHQNNIILDSFLFFIIHIFYTFLHFHNVYFSSPYLNLFLSFSIKLIYKYKNVVQCQSNDYNIDMSLDPSVLSYEKRENGPTINYDLPEQNIHSSNKPCNQINLLRRKKNIQKTCTLYNNSKNHIYNACSSEDITSINEEVFNAPNIIELIIKKQKFINKKQKKNYSFIGNDIFLFGKDKTKEFLPNTFDIIINSFFDLCISICSMNFKYISQKKQKLNMSYFCNNIIFYHHIINKSYNDKALDLFNRNNYNHSLECYSYYFDELKNDQSFINHFGKYKNTDTIFRHNIASQKKKKIINNKNKIISNIHKNNNHINDMIGMYKTKELSSNSSNILNENNLIKRKSKEKKKESNHKNENSNNSFDGTSNYYNDDNNYNTYLSFSSDESLNFLKYIKKRTTNRIYIDENNIINMLINIGCIFMNNIKYNAAITLNHIYKINQYDLLSDRQKFYHYIQKSFYNNKHMTFPYIYNQYFISFFFFFKIHYLFFLIKFKCENEIFLKAYWFLHAVYNITQN